MPRFGSAAPLLIRSVRWIGRRVPCATLARKVGGAREKLRHELGKEPSVEAIAAALGMDAEQVEDIITQLQTAPGAFAG